MKKIVMMLTALLAISLSACAGSNSEAEVGSTTENTNDGTGSKVYFTKEITPESLVSIYEALGVSAEGKRVAVKISTGESSRTNYLRPEFIKNLVQKHDIVGSHLRNYDLMVNLAHFKGHAMGGFGGVLKNQSIGMASSSGTGKRIVRWLVGAALSRGIKKIYLETSEAGRLLYSVLGFSDMKDMMHLSFSK